MIRIGALLLSLTFLSATVARAETRVVRVQSKVLGESRTLHVSLPINYRVAKQRYPVVILLDGQARVFFDLTVAAVGYDLIGDMRDYAMPAQIVVGVEQRDRSVDLARNGVLFTRFLVEELIPFIEREYRTLPFRTLIGHSLGGRFALQSFCRAPDAFAAVVAISASLPDSTMTEVQGCMRASFAKDAARVRQLVLCAGEREPRLLPTTARLQAFVRDSAPPTWRVRVVDGAGLGHTETPLAAIPPALRFIFDRTVWEMPASLADSVLARLGDPVAQLERYVATVSPRVGFRISPGTKWLEVTARTAVGRREPAAAIEAARRVVEEYPESMEGYTLLADAYLLKRDDVAARRTFADALRMLDKLEPFDEEQRAQRRESLLASLAALAR